MSGLMIALFILQILVALLLIIVVMLQSSDEDALSGIGASAGNSGILSHKSSVDFVTKLTIWLGIIMIVNSLALTLVVKRDYASNASTVEDYINKQQKEEEKKELPEDNKQQIEEVKETTVEKVK